jgi:thymidylate kinase
LDDRKGAAAMTTDGLAEALSRDGLCLADRWTLSALAYRCAEDRLLEGYVEAVNSVFPVPALTLLIDISVETSHRRGLPSAKNHYTRSDLSRVREQYLRLAAVKGLTVIPGEGDYEPVLQRTLNAIEQAISSRAREPTEEG